MQSIWNKYVLVESSISAVINAILSIGFAFAVFHGRAIVMAAGPGGFRRPLPSRSWVLWSLCFLPASASPKERCR
jgi:hypothetical protein